MSIENGPAYKDALQRTTAEVLAGVQESILGEASLIPDINEYNAHIRRRVEGVVDVVRQAFNAGITFSQSLIEQQGD